MASDEESPNLSDDLGAGDDDIDDEDEDQVDFSPEKTPAPSPGDPAAPADTYENQPFDEAMALTDESSISDQSDGEADADGLGALPGAVDSMMVTNQSYDEAIDVSDASTVSPAATTPGMMQHHAQDEESSDDGEGYNEGPMTGDMHDMNAQDTESSSDSDDSDGDIGDAQGISGMAEDGEDGAFKPIEGGYNPADFENIDCSADVKDLFMYISRYKPHQVELESCLKPFIPEFIPAVGDIDAFIRVPRPDNCAAKEDTIGLTVLDEPAAVQTDRAALEMQLRAFTKKSGLAAQNVTSIEDAGNNAAAIHKWIASVNELHTSKPQTTIAFSKPMPDIEALMQVWPASFEEMLGSVPLPPPNLDMSVEEYAKVCCSLLDIPVQDNLIHSLHTMCMLYSEFKGNQHFGVQSTEPLPPMQGGMPGMPMQGMY